MSKILEELNPENDILDASILRTLTGNDVMFCRQLYRSEEMKIGKDEVVKFATRNLEHYCS